VSEIEARLEALLEHDRAQERQLEQASRRLARADFEMLLGGVMEVKGARVLAARWTWPTPTGCARWPTGSATG
jgi:hypothetical protein